MKAITIWQPWASLIAVGAKRYETRSWPTNYRGPIAIHAAKKNPLSIIRGLHPTVQVPILYALCKAFGIKSGVIDRLRMTTGCIVATAELIECWEIRMIDEDAEALFKKHHPTIVDNKFVNLKDEIMFGNFTKGRFAWELANVQILDTPIPARGKQGLWEWDQPITEVAL